ncbi:hypothetical protein KY345_03145 [Candidatus Woesearchaeota archaeon]|nr:hypothetical protein [Candidatus Woesearchaeota archaeon]
MADLDFSEIENCHIGYEVDLIDKKRQFKQVFLKDIIGGYAGQARHICNQKKKELTYSDVYEVFQSESELLQAREKVLFRKYPDVDDKNTLEDKLRTYANLVMVGRAMKLIEEHYLKPSLQPIS